MKKILLIAAYEDVLPREIWNRPKQGFVFPFQEWLKNDLFYEMLSQENTHTQYLANQFKVGKLEWSRFWSLCVMHLFDHSRKKTSYQTHPVALNFA